MTESKRIQELHEKLIQTISYPFTPKGKRVIASDDQGVYIIYTPEDVVLHVGTTKRGEKGLAQRLNNHRNGSSSFYRLYLEPKNIVLSDGFKFKYLVVHDARERVLLEALSIGLLCPKHVGTGVKLKLK